MTASEALSSIPIDTARQPIRWPVQMAYGHVEGISVGHPSYIRHRSPHSRARSGLRAKLVRHELRMDAVILDQRAKYLDDRARLGQRSGPHVDPLVIELSQRCKRRGLLGRHPDFAMIMGRPYDGPDEGVQLVAPSSPTDSDDLGREIIWRHDASPDGVFKIMSTVGDPVRPADDVALDSERRGT